jgi:hypothetical protein
MHERGQFGYCAAPCAREVFGHFPGYSQGCSGRHCCLVGIFDRVYFRIVQTGAGGCIQLPADIDSVDEYNTAQETTQEISLGDTQREM